MLALAPQSRCRCRRRRESSWRSRTPRDRHRRGISRTARYAPPGRSSSSDSRTGAGRNRGSAPVVPRRIRPRDHVRPSSPDPGSEAPSSAGPVSCGFSGRVITGTDPRGTRRLDPALLATEPPSRRDRLRQLAQRAGHRPPLEGVLGPRPTQDLVDDGDLEAAARGAPAASGPWRAGGDSARTGSACSPTRESWSPTRGGPTIGAGSWITS